ncbi:HNH endonuclease [Delftia tsuruhatensis]|uniref:HNH endonuclease n=2 Tax=Delftia tsuruhatensis TaxID=180282 RepID=UPI0009BAEE33|nr:HNH endonuclease [Delftia tsuruhatensis]
MTEWAIVCDFPDYEVSTAGVIRRLTQTRGTVKGQIIKWHTCTSTGYPDVRLRRDGRSYSIAVHRIVARAFLGERAEGDQIRHIDGNKLNAEVRNLAYGSAVENAQDKIAHGRSFFTGRTNPKAKMTVEGAAEIRQRKTNGERAKDLAAEFGLCESTVYRIASGMYWQEASNRVEGRTVR